MTRTLVIHRPRQTRGLVPQEHILNGVAIKLYPGRDELGKPLMAGLLPEDPEVARLVKRQVRRMGGVYTLGDEAVVEVWADASPDGLYRMDDGTAGPEVLPPTPGVPPMLAAAQRNGWTESDLEGAGQGGDWSLKGGTGKTSGLSVAQMALVKAPPNWLALQATHQPWEVTGWRPPDDFVPPVVKSKLTDKVQGPTTTVVKPEEPEEPAEKPAEKPAGDGSPSQVIEDALADLDEDQRAGALMVLAELVKKANGSAPSIQKANHWIRKAGLPSLDQDALGVLLTMI